MEVAPEVMLDKILAIFKIDAGNKVGYTINQIFRTVSDAEGDYQIEIHLLEEAILKLVKDGFLRPIPEYESRDGFYYETDIYYRITFEGIVLKGRNGYVQQAKNRLIQRKKDIAYTLLVALGTALAGL